MTTTTIDTPDVSTCPAWCRGWHSSSADDPGVEYHEGTIGPDPYHGSHGVLVTLMRKDLPGAATQVMLLVVDDEQTDQLAAVYLTPGQAAKVAGLLTEAVSQAL